MNDLSSYKAKSQITNLNNVKASVTSKYFIIADTDTCVIIAQIQPKNILFLFTLLLLLSFMVLAHASLQIEIQVLWGFCCNQISHAVSLGKSLHLKD